MLNENDSAFLIHAHKIKKEENATDNCLKNVSKRGNLIRSVTLSTSALEEHLTASNITRRNRHFQSVAGDDLRIVSTRWVRVDYLCNEEQT
jgi:hypothetical protein